MKADEEWTSRIDKERPIKRIIGLPDPNEHT